MTDTLAVGGWSVKRVNHC